jgi:acyl-coenzyme A thioesterase PaaI-like protein
VDDVGFVGLIGPFYSRVTADGAEIAVHCQDKHRNRIGVVHGGLLMTFADRALVVGAQSLGGVVVGVTVQLDMQFITTARVGDVVVARPVLAPGTRSLQFLRTDLTVGSTVVARASGIFTLARQQP